MGIIEGVFIGLVYIHLFISSDSNPNMGIIVGVSIGLACILFCVLILNVRNRCFPPLHHQVTMGWNGAILA
jgi:hypothetical protein